MVNTVLTPTMVTKRALLILHQKLNFVGKINRQYDDSFAVSGARIGSTLKIRLPNQYTVSTGQSLSTQTTTETSTTLTVATQKHVDTSFTSQELTLSLDDFAERILDPAMAVLAANIEADAFTMLLNLYNTVDATTATSVQLSTMIDAGVVLDQCLAPRDGKRAMNLRPRDTADLYKDVKGLFQDSSSIAESYKEGTIGRTVGFDFYQNTLIPSMTSGTMSATSVTTVTSTIVPATSQSTINVGNSLLAGTMVAGDVFAITGLNKCHAESKADLGVLQQFVVTSLATLATASSIAFSPAISMGGATQNVVSTAINGSLIVKLGNTSRVLKQSVFFHRDAFTFATADLIMPKNQHFAAREVMDGISMRIWQAADITNDAFPCRIDVLYGFLCMRPEIAGKIYT